MLSPGQWHKEVPRDLYENCLYRLDVLDFADQHPDNRAAFLMCCAEDILYWINTFVIQYNPNAIGDGSLKVGPFVTWDFQEEAVFKILSAIEDRRDLLIEKSREMGASWLCLLIMLWRFLFHPFEKFLCISRSEEAVESSDADSLFWKLDFVLEHLPEWMLPVKGIRRKKRFFGNLSNRSSITGQATSGKSGVGGRATAMFIDEFPQIDEDFEIHRRTTLTSDCRIFNGTHKGTETCFAELSQLSDRLGTPRKLVMHWTMHPDKRRGLYRYNVVNGQVDVLDKQYAYPVDFKFKMVESPAGGPFPGLRSPWYDRKEVDQNCRRATAMDLDIDMAGSVSQFFNPLTLTALRQEYSRPPLWEGDIHFDPDTGRPLGLVALPGGPLKLWMYPKHDGTLPVDEYGLGADISTGVGSTNSVAAAICSSTGEGVMEYATCTVKPEALAPLVTALGWLLKNQYGEPALFAWEHHGPGQVFGEAVLTLNYGRVWCRETSEKVSEKLRKSDIPGWYPSPPKKRLLLEDYRYGLEKHRCVVRSDEAMLECRHYRYNAQGHVEHPHDVGGDDPTGARVNHGDRVIAYALGWKMAQLAGKPQNQKTVKEQAPVGSLAWRKMLVEQQRKESEAWA